jgi:phage-related protein
LAYCKNCGLQIADNTYTCPRCNVVQQLPLPPMQTTPPNPYLEQRQVGLNAPYIQQRRPSKALPIIGIIAGVFALIVVVVLVVFGIAVKVKIDENNAKVVARNNHIHAMDAAIASDKELDEQTADRISHLNGSAVQKLDKLAVILNDYVQAAGRIDLSACPEEFAQAYSQYLSAISDWAQTISAHPEIPSDDELAIADLVRGVGADTNGTIAQAEGELQGEVKIWASNADAKEKTMDNARDNVNSVYHAY